MIARYAYDVEGRRIAKRVYSTASGGVLGYTRFVYRGAHVGFETDSAGTTGMKYVWGLNIDDLIAFEDGAGNHYYVAKDKVGSIRNVATRSGTWVMRLRHRPYGALIDSVGTGVMLRYRWTGREWDAELGWYFMRARYYDPVASRFTQEDPIGFAGGNNVYAYVDGSPLEARDPTGLKAGNVDGPFEGFCFGGGTCVNWDGSISRGGSGWGTGGGGGGGGGGGDWNGDGRDDVQDFGDYAWGRQRWLENGGTISEFQALDFIITYGFADPGMQAAARQAVKFGRFVPGGLGSDAWGEYDPKTRKIILNWSSETATATGRDGTSVPMSIFNDPNLSNGAFILAHELGHYGRDLGGVPYVPDTPRTPGGPLEVDKGEERAASCMARRATGARHPAIYHPCW